MIFIIMLKFTSKEEDSYHKLKLKKLNFIINEKDSKIKNLYEIKLFINKYIVYFRDRGAREKKFVI